MTDLERKVIALRAAEELVRKRCCNIASEERDGDFYIDLIQLEKAIAFLRDCGKAYAEVKAEDSNLNAESPINNETTS